MKWKRFLSTCRIRNKGNRSQDFSAALFFFFFTKQNALDDIFNQEKRKKEIKKIEKLLFSYMFQMHHFFALLCLRTQSSA